MPLFHLRVIMINVPTVISYIISYRKNYFIHTDLLYCN